MGLESNTTHQPTCDPSQGPSHKNSVQESSTQHTKKKMPTRFDDFATQAYTLKHKGDRSYEDEAAFDEDFQRVKTEMTKKGNFSLPLLSQQKPHLFLVHQYRLHKLYKDSLPDQGMPTPADQPTINSLIPLMNNLSRDEDPKGEATRANNVLRQKFKTYIRQKGFAGTAVFFRGSKTGLDPTYACMAHDGQPRRYGMIVIDGGEVVDRRTFGAAQRSEVEKLMARMHDDGLDVHVDQRTDRALLPLTRSIGSPIDCAQFRRAKSDVEKTALASLGSATYDRLYRDQVTSRGAFRNANMARGVPPSWKAAFSMDDNRFFRNVRVGYQDDLGRVSDGTRVYGKTPEWKARVERVHRGFDAVREHVVAGAKVSDLQDRFMARLDSEKDVVYGQVISHIGFSSTEPLGVDTLGEHEMLRLGCAVGDLETGKTAIFYHPYPVGTTPLSDDAPIYGSSSRSFGDVLDGPRYGVVGGGDGGGSGSDDGSDGGDGGFPADEFSSGPNVGVVPQPPAADELPAAEESGDPELRTRESQDIAAARRRQAEQRKAKAAEEAHQAEQRKQAGQSSSGASSSQAEADVLPSPPPVTPRRPETTSATAPVTLPPDTTSAPATSATAPVTPTTQPVNPQTPQQQRLAQLGREIRDEAGSSADHASAPPPQQQPAVGVPVGQAANLADLQRQLAAAQQQVAAANAALEQQQGQQNAGMRREQVRTDAMINEARRASQQRDEARRQNDEMRRYMEAEHRRLEEEWEQLRLQRQQQEAQRQQQAPPPPQDTPQERYADARANLLTLSFEEGASAQDRYDRFMDRFIAHNAARDDALGAPAEITEEQTNNMILQIASQINDPELLDMVRRIHGPRHMRR